MRGSGLMIESMESVMSSLGTNAFIRETMRMGSLRELESMLGPMGNAMRDNGLMDSSMDQECGGGLKVIRI